jgi:hypothetical protein
MHRLESRTQASRLKREVHPKLAYACPGGRGSACAASPRMPSEGRSRPRGSSWRSGRQGNRVAQEAEDAPNWVSGCRVLRHCARCPMIHSAKARSNSTSWPPLPNSCHLLCRGSPGFAGVPPSIEGSGNESSAAVGTLASSNITTTEAGHEHPALRCASAKHTMCRSRIRRESGSWSACGAWGSRRRCEPHSPRPCCCYLPLPQGSSLSQPYQACYRGCG